MAIPISMPKLGMTMEEGTLLQWEVDVGAPVEKGQLLYVIESEKTEAEIEAPASGFLRHVYVDAGEIVPCGTLVAAIADAPDGDFDADAFRQEHDRPAEVASAPAPSAPASPAAPSEPRVGGRRAVAPAARKLARELDVDLERIPGTGPGGRVTREDVGAYADARAALVGVGDGIGLEVPRLGAGDPVLLLPGFGTDVSSFAVQTAGLAERHLVLGVNPQGVGLSDDPELEVHPVSRTAADAAAVIDGPVHVVGASLGAAAAIELALEHPDRVRSLTLITPFVHVGARLRAVTDAWTRIASEASAETLARALLPWLFSADWLADETARERGVRGLAASVGRVRAPALARIAAGLRAWSGTRAEDLSRIGAPTLVVVAGADLLTPNGAAVATAIPQAECLEIRAAGHAVAVEAADVVTERLLSHLAAH